MVKTEKFARVEVASQDELRQWLSANHAQAESVWLVTYKKATPDKYVSTGQVLDELLCYGWIDGMRRKHPKDENRTMQLISPRRVQHWSKTYKDRAARLIAEGKMEVPGHASIEASKVSGLWNFLDDVDALIVPADLQAAFDKNPGAKNFYENQGDATKRFALRWIKLAKGADTRKKRIEKTVKLFNEGKRIPGS
ncbi:MAG: YdeI/OmpD-associated family protein [Bacteroidota bacterium]